MGTGFSAFLNRVKLEADIGVAEDVVVGMGSDIDKEGGADLRKGK